MNPDPITPEPIVAAPVQPVAAISEKTLLQSKTIIGALVAALCLILQLTGIVDVSDVEQATLVGSLADIIVSVGSVASIVLIVYGRIKASEQIKLPAVLSKKPL